MLRHLEHVYEGHPNNLHTVTPTELKLTGAGGQGPET